MGGNISRELSGFISKNIFEGSLKISEKKKIRRGQTKNTLEMDNIVRYCRKCMMEFSNNYIKDSRRWTWKGTPTFMIKELLVY